MGLILTRSPFHISRGTLDANASALVEVGRIDGGAVEVLEEYVCLLYTSPSPRD